MPTINERIKLEVAKLEGDIETLVKDFEQTTGLGVTRIKVTGAESDVFCKVSIRLNR